MLKNNSGMLSIRGKNTNKTKEKMIPPLSARDSKPLKRRNVPAMRARDEKAIINKSSEDMPRFMNGLSKLKAFKPMKRTAYSLQYEERKLNFILK